MATEKLSDICEGHHGEHGGQEPSMNWTQWSIGAAPAGSAGFPGSPLLVPKHAQDLLGALKGRHSRDNDGSSGHWNQSWEAVGRPR